MNGIDLLGWLAAALTVLAFLSHDVCLLRLSAVGASLSFIAWAALTQTWPVLALHLTLLPVNVVRLLQSRGGMSSWAHAAHQAGFGNPHWMAVLRARLTPFTASRAAKHTALDESP